MIELPSHARCCRSPVDKARHELDRGMRAIEKEKAKGRDPGKSLVAFVAKWERRTRELELAAFNKQ